MATHIKTYYFCKKFSFEKITDLLKQKENFSVHTKSNHIGTTFFILNKATKEKVIEAHFAPHNTHKCQLLHLLELGK